MIDKGVNQQVLGCLMKRPQILSEIDKYSLSMNDFGSQFEKVIFLTIQTLYNSGAKRVGPIDIITALNTNPTGKAIFEKSNGAEYVQDLQDWTDEDNFDAYYSKLKKLNLLRDLKKQGFKVDEFYCEDLTQPNADKINAAFDKLTTKDIVDGVKKKLLKLENSYSVNDEVTSGFASDNIRELFKSIQSKQTVGVPVQGKIYNQIIDGAQKQTLTIRSGSSGLGKALPNSIEIPTPTGFRKVGDIKVGDFLFDAQGNPTKVLGVFPQGKQQLWKLYFYDGTSATCSGDHLWSFYKNGKPRSTFEADEREFETLTTEEIYETKIQLFGEPKIWMPLGKIAEGSKEFEINIEDALENLKKDIPLPKTASLMPLEARRCLSSDIEFAFENENEWEKLSNETKDSVYLLERSLGIRRCYNRMDGTIQRTAHYTQYLAQPLAFIMKLNEEEDMTCFLVDNDEHLFLTENFIVTHNTRIAVADACYLAYPYRYEKGSIQWVQNGNSQKVLFIITEQSITQIQSMILAYLTHISEDRFKTPLSDAENKLVSQAFEIMEKYKDNFIIVRIPDPNIELIKMVIREQCMTHDIGIVFYDYIFISPNLLNEFRGFALRNDELLLLMTTALKDLAVELDVPIFTSTQVNANVDDNKNIRNEASLAGGRSTINKADNGIIMSRPTTQELEVLQPVIEQYGKPNVVSDVFKVRSGRWTQVRIWSIVDLGTMRRRDLFLTDAALEVIKDFKFQDISVNNWTNDEAASVAKEIEKLNGELKLYAKELPGDYDSAND